MPPADFPGGAPGPVAARGQTILVVEDERHTRMALKRFLEKEGWSTVGFATASEAQTWLTSDAPRIDATTAAGPAVGGAVIDVHLPDGDGIDLTRALRDRVGEHVPIVIVSGDTSMDTLRRLRDAGGNRFVGKPMSLAALRDALAGNQNDETRNPNQ